MDIGVFGGTFDPIHIGHLIVAEEVRVRLRLEEVLFIPAGQPWLKTERDITPAYHRAEMVSLAIASNPYFKLSTIEIERPGPSYSVETLATLQHQLGGEARLFFLLGSDSLVELPQWKEPSRLIQLCQLVAFSREGSPPPQLKTLEPIIPGITRCVSVVDVPQIWISSTQIRRRVAEGLPIRYLVPETVERYIKEHSLYIK